MRITSLHLYGFGQFSDVKLDFNSNFQIIYGENEAGKTTLLSFVYAILFGFPTKTQSENRYFPRMSHQYGGSLSLEATNFGNITIERVYDKSKVGGTVKVFLENGMTKDETFISELLGSMNKEIFKAIYAFDLTGLHNIENLNGDELGNYLLSAGIVGNGRLQEVESYLEKQQAELYKPSGRKPLLNEKLEEQLSLSQQLKVLKSKNDSYYLLKETIEQKNFLLNELSEQKLKFQENIRRLEKFEQAIPLIQKKREIEKLLEQTLIIDQFPQNGVDRYHAWQEKIIEIDGDISFHEKELTALKTKLTQLQINGKLLENKGEIQKFVTEQNYFRELIYEQSSIIQKIDDLHSNGKTILAKLGPSWNENSVLSVQANIAAKEQLTDMTNHADRLLQQQNFLDEEIERRSESLEQLEEREKLIQSSLLHQKEKEQFQLQVQQYAELKFLKDKKEKLLERKDILRTQKSTIQKGDKLFPLLLIIAGVLFSAYWFFLQEWIVGILLAISFIGSGGYIYRFYPARSNKSDTALQDVQAELSLVEEQLNKFLVKNWDEQKLEETKWILRNNEQKSSELFSLTDRLREAKQAYEKIVERYDRWELDWKKLMLEFHEWKETYHFPLDVTNLHLLGQYEWIASFQDNHFTIQLAKKRLDKINDLLTSRNEHISRIYHETLDNELPVGQDPIMYLQQKLEAEQLNVQDKLSIENKYKQEVESIQMLNDRRQKYERECNNILELAKVSDENTLALKAKELDKQLGLKEQLHLINAQLEITLPQQLLQEFEEIEDLESIIMEKQLLKEKVDVVEAEEQVERKDLTEVEVTLKQLEEEGSYSKSIHKYELGKFETEELAKQWAVYKVAEWMIIRTKEKFQKERLPQVLKLASFYLEKFTRGNYTNIYLSENQREVFLLERKDKQRFSTIEVSRGTAEQLYLAIRLALAKEYHTKELLPLILDDILVNFDQHRTSESITILKELACDRQILFFTCHKHNLQHFSSSDIIDLNKIKVPV